MFNGKQFIYILEDESFVCITSADNLQCMTTKCSDLFAGGIFNHAPKYTTQLYTIHGFKNGYYLPLICIKKIEKAAHQAASKVFEDVQLISCRFHLGHSWWRKINSDSVLRLAYKKR
ncbi:Uncharacterized protein FWK35_00005320 [Aphis craccivora]|uniref:MULE domain-containing protein n=1 Tax=Aphis craccivora TaxID=307492 RepID=A0A6G0YHC7_APHCR|nr:Uncharacterized protein FWK35_00005320 [Aphis craccivora]